MSEMKNARPRFGLEGSRVFDYVTSKYLPSEGVYAAANGVAYDLEEVVKALESDGFIDNAIVGRVPATGEGHMVFGDDSLHVPTPKQPPVDFGAAMGMETRVDGEAAGLEIPSDPALQLRNDTPHDGPSLEEQKGETDGMSPPVPTED